MLKKKSKYISYEELFSEVMRNADLTGKEKDDILKQCSGKLWSELKSCVEEFKTQIRREIVHSGEIYNIDETPGGEYDYKKYMNFFGSEIHEHFLDNYELTEQAVFEMISFDGEVAPQLIGPIIGDKMYEHALTPAQADLLIEKLKEKAESKTEEKGELPNYILFIKCSNYRKGLGMREIDPNDSKTVMLVSLNIYWYLVSNRNPEKVVNCSSAMIGTVDGNNVEHCGTNLPASRSAYYFLNTKVDTPLPF